MNVVLISTFAVTSADPGDRLAVYGTLILLEVPLNTASEPVKVTSVGVPLLESAESLASAVNDHDEITAAWATPGMAAIARMAIAVTRASFRIENLLGWLLSSERGSARRLRRSPANAPTNTDSRSI